MSMIDSIEEEYEDKIEVLNKRIEELEIENAKLNIILYHRENGLSHPDFNAEIEISKQAERIKELEAALRKYGDHLGACYWNLRMGHCNCGFEQALKPHS